MKALNMFTTSCRLVTPVLLLITSSIIEQSHMAKIYVSRDGIPSAPCGKSPDNGCSNLAVAFTQAIDGDTIYLDGRSRSFVHSLCGRVNTSLEFNKAVQIVGLNGRPKLGCPPAGSHWNDHYIVTFGGGTAETITIRNLEFVHGQVIVYNTSVILSNVHFYNASFSSLETDCNQLAVNIQDSRWTGLHRCNKTGSCNKTETSFLSCIHLHVTVLRTEFYQTMLALKGRQTTEVTVSQSLFSNRKEEASRLGGLHLTCSSAYALVVLENSTFEKQIHPTKVKSVSNLFEGAIWLKSKPDKHPSNATVYLNNIHLHDNERGITLVGPFKKGHMTISNSLFTYNQAMHAGSGLLVLLERGTSMQVDNCTFMHNAAGRYRQKYSVAELPGTFEVLGNEVRVDDDYCKGVITLVGKGGAIRVQRGGLLLTNSRFVNNTARLLGGSVFIDIDGTLEINDTLFENTAIHDHSLQGDVLYSDGRVTVNRVTLIVQSARNSLSVLRHSGDHWTLKINDVRVQCPVGYDLQVTNSSAYGVTSAGLRRSHKLDQLSYFCESCPRNKYSLDYGYLNYTMKYSGFAYFTLLINGTKPQPSFIGEYVHHTINCMRCPYGGHCLQGITAVANFWGYVQDKEVRFQHCPHGYCCEKPECPTIDTCQKLREGPLCGRCKTGFAEALFSTTCVPNDTCGPFWLWPFALCIGAVYTLFLLGQTDLKQFLFSEPIKCPLWERLARQPPTTFMNGRTRMETTSFQHPRAQGTTDSPITEPCLLPEGLKHRKVRTAERESTAPFTQAERKPKVAGDRGFLIILFYYFQDALLLNVKTVYVINISKSQRVVKTVLSGLFKFQLDIFELIEEVCAYAGMTPSHKLLAKALIVPYVLGLFALMYLGNKLYRCVRPSSRTLPSSRNTGVADTCNKTFNTRLASGFILALLFSFQKLSLTMFTLLNCVGIENRSVLYMDGHVVCYTNWQYVVIAYATSCLAPFGLVLMLGPGLLAAGDIGLCQFFVALLLPPPFLVWWAIRHCYSTKRKSTSARQLRDQSAVARCATHTNGGNGQLPPAAATSPSPTPKVSNCTRAVLQVLQGPFKQRSLCWAGVLIARRLVLILIFTFVNDALIRMLLMLLACFFNLLQHMSVKPYKTSLANIVGTSSAAALITLCSINLVRAGFEAAEYTPSGPNAYLMRVFAELENLLLLWLPAVILSAIILLLLYRTVILVTNKISGRDEEPDTVEMTTNTQL